MHVAVLGEVGCPLGERLLRGPAERRDGGVVEVSPAARDGKRVSEVVPVHVTDCKAGPAEWRRQISGVGYHP